MSDTVFARVEFDLFCEWRDRPPSYRLYINDEMFNERTYIWKGTKYLREIVQLDAPPGEYKITIENLGEGSFSVRNLTAVKGPVEIKNSTTFEIAQ